MIALRSFGRCIPQCHRIVFAAQPARFLSQNVEPKFEFVLTDLKGSGKNVGLIQLNRPKALNALCAGLIRDISLALDQFEADDNVKAIILTGSDRAFAGQCDNRQCVILFFHNT
ncbi:unnamed protein product [Echinostoma caproni]|uniref:3-hydroxyisobutyryl-CoA hydrolase n=1 Tax=Echinostoma caproni TaxID=27848 RepID=A0A183BDQ1_9TREM|nr:unnamed protein product [Echinostoma caproni]